MTNHDQRGIPPTESRMLDEVRRWRREAYEARQRMTPEELEKHDARLAEKLGFSRLPIMKVPGDQPAADRRKRAG